MKYLRSFLIWLMRFISKVFLWILRLLPMILILSLSIVITIGIVTFLYTIGGSGFSGKTLWDWLNLLIVPLILGIGTIFINTTIQSGEQQRADDRLKEQALQSYLDHMSELLLSGVFDDLDNKDKARIVAKARTLTTLHGLDGRRKGAVLQFLYESHLLAGDAALVLDKADLSQTNLVGINLSGVNLYGADLSGADFSGTDLSEADLTGARLKGAKLRGAYLTKASLSESRKLKKS